MSHQPLLEVKGLTRRFGGIIANNNVSFEVQKDSITSLIGPNGAGKTTVFNCITGFYAATAGEIFLHGPTGTVEVGNLLNRPFTGGSYLVSRAGIARTFQNIRLFKDMTVLENLLVAQHRAQNRNLLAGILVTHEFSRKEEESVNRAYEWLDIVDLAVDANRLAGELSYGRQRRLEIARAMCTNPCLVCLDEPAAGLNPRETVDLSQLIRKLRDECGATVLLIEHDMGLVMDISEHIVVMDQGSVIDRGDPGHIRNSEAVIAAYLGTEVEDEA
ncbi:ABC transporter ATP-binding protein [Advenella sp. RU8]|uniref:ABC transporter ATP-binding protein n=1 Tax=Advenella sp. RU8 TaxID=3399575 RepID=UPI003AAC01C2